MSEYDERTNEEYDDGRSVQIDTGFYQIQVWGDTDDSFEMVMEKAMEAADRARKDAEEMDENYNNGGGEHYQ